MAVTFAGGVVMGADSRTSTGNYVANRVSDKLTPVHDQIYCCRSGSAADTQAVSDIVKYYLDSHSIELGHQPLVKTAASLFQDITYQNKDRLLASIIVGGNKIDTCIYIYIYCFVLFCMSYCIERHMFESVLLSTKTQI
jgi:20S proteasome subunit beta 1